LHLGQMFLDEQSARPAAACSRLASRLAPGEARVEKLASRLAEEAPEAAAAPEEEVLFELEATGVPAQMSAEMAICLLMCASDAARTGDTHRAAAFTVRARGLVGDEAARALIQLINESDAELAQEKAAGAGTEGA